MNSKLCYTAGDPLGIGMDIILQLSQQQVLKDITVLACRENLQARAKLLGHDIQLLTDCDEVIKQGQLAVKDVPFDKIVSSKTSKSILADQIIALLDQAILGCQQGKYSAMVTGPLNKALINDAGINFSGHTEYLAEKTQAPLPVMMLATDDLRVALLTTHLPLKDVANAINEQLIVDICQVVNNDLQTKYGIKQPSLLLCGLNPHAGEGGYLGREEIDVFTPALKLLRERGVNISDPLPADTLFQPRYLDNADIVIACYHDQGLPVLKFHGFGRAANITLGLPIVRTSVDHGTAYDLVGTGEADIGSLLTALDQARQMSHTK